VKFLCEHCKAKYQIADEKVAGRTVRMKCRKCGASIEVRAAVASASASGGSTAGGSERPEPIIERLPPRPSPAAQPGRGVPAAKPAGPHESHLAGAFQRNVQREEDSTSASFSLRELSAADEWYVAVNGVPVGPVRIGEVRRKAAMGAVTEESLCWQEGMEEWRTIKTVTELAAVVREAASGGRGSQLPPEPRKSAPPAPRVGSARATGQHAVSPAPREPVRAPHAPAAPRPPARRPIDSFDDESAATVVGRSPMLEMEEPVVQTNGAPVGAVAAAAVDPFRAAAPDPFRAPAEDPFKAYNNAQAFDVAPGPAGAVSASAPLGVQPAPTPFAAPAPVVVAASRRVSPIIVGMFIMFAGFGAMAAYLLFQQKQQRPIIVNVPAPPTATTAAPASGPAPGDIPAATRTTPTATAIDAGAVKVASTTPRATGGAPATSGPKTTAVSTDPALRDLINGTSGGPSAGPSGGGAGGGAQLTEDEVKQVVTAHNLGVRRTCWDRSPSTTPSVNVTVHMVISGSGQVTSANATGNDPIVQHCLEDEVKRWRWPGGGNVDVPFHFLRQ